MSKLELMLFNNLQGLRDAAGGYIAGTGDNYDELLDAIDVLFAGIKVIHGVKAE